MRVSDVYFVFVGVGEGVDDRWRWEVVLGFVRELRLRWLAVASGERMSIRPE